MAHDRSLEIVEIEGRTDDVACTELCRSVREDRVPEAGDDDDGHRRSRRSQSLQNLEARWQQGTNIEDDDREDFPTRALERGRTVRYGHDSPALRFEKSNDDVAKVLIILGDEDAALRLCSQVRENDRHGSPFGRVARRRVPCIGCATSMRLTIKLVLWFFACVVLAVGINGFYGVRGELERYETDLAERHVVMGRVLRAAFSEVMDTDGETRAVSMLDYTDKRMRLVDVRWVHLDAGASPERRAAAPLADLTPLYSEHEVHQKNSGKLRSYVAMHIEGRPLSALEFSESLDGEQAVVRRAVIREVRAVGAVAFAIGIAAAILGIVLVARPMRGLIGHARRVGQGDLSPVTVSDGKDEISQLAREMNAMCAQLTSAQAARLNALEQLRHAERLSTVGTLASGLAHELGTPLNVIALRAKSITKGRATGDRAKEAAASIAEQAARMTNLVRQLLDFARRRTPQRDVVDIKELMRRTADLIETVAAKANVRCDLDLAGAVPKVRGDAGQLEQVLTNLLMNAIQAMPSGGSIHVSAGLVRAAPPADHGGSSGEYVRIAVQDEGLGISGETLPHIFEPFFTTKDVGVGTGLGLAVCYGIVRDHGGWIDVTSAAGEGSELRVYLPKELS
jgi:two-component system, NtrC family, sensor kinase